MIGALRTWLLSIIAGICILRSALNIVIVMLSYISVLIVWRMK